MGSIVRLVSIGDCCADIYDNGRVSLGGTAYNVALAAQRAGAQASIFSSVGTDAVGKEIAENLQKNRVDTSHLKIIQGKTSSIPIHLDTQGSPQYGRWDLGPMKNLHITDRDISFLKSQTIVRAVLFTPIRNLFDEFCRLDLGKSLKVGDFAGTSSDSVDVEKIAPYADKLDIIIKSVEKPREKPLALLTSLAQKYHCLVLALLGSDGSVVFTKDQVYRQAALKVATKNTTGAGDVYQAFFLTQYARTGRIQESMKRATVAAAEAITSN